MKRLLGNLLPIVSILSIPFVHADIAGFEIGAYQWKPDYEGTLASDSVALAGTPIDVQDDLGFTDDSNNIIWASLEHPVPVLPNIKVVSSDIDTTASSTLNREIVFGGETFNINEDVVTGVDMSNTEYTFYYEILDNWINLDLGLTIRQYDGEVELSTATTTSIEDLDFTIPLLYAAVRADLPFTGFFVDAELNIISYQGDSISDTLFALGYESEIGLGAKLGYRTFSLDVEEDTFTGDLDFEGTYISLFYHF